MHDNHGLYQALKSRCPVLPVFIFDTNILSDLAEKKDRRVNFIYQNLRQLQKTLENIGSFLYVLSDTPLAAFELIGNITPENLVDME